MSVLSDDQIDALLAADEQDNASNQLAIFARIHERRRKRAHVKAKAAQPNLGMHAAPHIWDALLSAARAPLTDEDAEPGGNDYLCQTVQDCLDAGNFDDALFALVRVWRKQWAWQRHLGPIEGAQTNG